MIDTDYRYKLNRFPMTLKNYSMDNGILNLATEDNLGELLKIVISIYRKGLIGIRISPVHDFDLEYDFVDKSCRELDQNASLVDRGEKISITIEKHVININKSPYYMEITSETGEVIYIDSVDDVNSVGEGLDRIFPIGYTYDEDGILGCNISAVLRQDEHIYGLGERFTEFDKRGQKVVMKNFDTLGCRDNNAYKNIPFYVSTYNYGLYVNSPLMTEFNIGYESVSSISIHTPDKNLEYFIILGDDLKDIVSKYMRLTGPAALPPKWSFGLWYSTGFKDSSQESVLLDAKHFRDTRVPCDVFHFDCYWLRDDMWCDFVWDETMYPERLEMLKKLKEDGYKICLWINPYVTIKTDMYKEGSKLGYFVKDKDGNAYTDDLWHGLLSLCAIVDFTNPEAVKWYKEKVSRVLNEGVDVLKTDFGEDIPYDGVFYNGKTGIEMRNLYSILYNEAVYEVTKLIKGSKNALVWARSGFAGMQRFPVCWSGDPRSSYEGMSSTLRAGLSMAMSGVPFWSHDIGGFYGKVEDDVFIRWAQFGLFSSHSRLHGTTTRQPWAYSERTNEIVSKYIRLRYKLMPYILKTAGECVKDSLPFIRPLVLEHSDDPTVFNIYDQYYFGKDIMVAPVFGPDQTKRKIYLPEGVWKDYLTGEEHEGFQWISVWADLEYMPIFIRNNAEIPIEENYKNYL